MQSSSKTLLLLAATLLSFSIAGCQSPPRRDEANSTKAAKATPPPEVTPDEVSLKEDRSALDSIRQEIPEQIKRENDETAFIRGLMSQGDEEPAKIRERFNKALRDRREKSDRQLRTEREDFIKNERKGRESFLKEMQQERTAFGRRKSTADQSREFFRQHEEKKNHFFAEERDKRKDFDSRLAERRQVFADYVREKTNEFNQELRAYTDTFYERKKAEALKKRTVEKAKKGLGSSASGIQGPGKNAPSPGATADPLLEEFKQIPKTPATPLGR